MSFPLFVFQENIFPSIFLILKLNIVNLKHEANHYKNLFPLVRKQARGATIAE